MRDINYGNEINDKNDKISIDKTNNMNNKNNVNNKNNMNDIDNIGNINSRNGIASMVIASVCFAMMSVMVKLSGGRIPLFQQVFFRNIVMIFFAIITLYAKNISIKVKKENIVRLSLRCVFGFLGVIALFYANNHLLLANAQILQKTNPLFVAILAIFILGEAPTLKRSLLLIGGFVGAFIIINPTGDFHNIKASIIGLSSALFGAIAYTMVGKMSGRVDKMVIIFYFSLFSSLASVIPMVKSYVMPTALEWIYLILIGVFAAGGQYFITKAYTSGRASTVAFFDYTGVVISPLLGLLIFSESISVRIIIGMVLIIICGYLSSRIREK